MIQFITHTNERYDYLGGVRMALEGGCRWIQLRMKDASEKEILKTAESTRKLCKKYGAVFLLDDYVELVERTGADGVHLGKNDMPIDEARRLLGTDRIIGGTANTFEDVKRIYSAGADYIGFVFSPSKRQVTLEQAAELAKFIPSHIQKVGVFVSPSRAELLEAVDKVGLDLVQVHGQVADDLFEDLPCASIQAVQVDRDGHVPNSQADYLLFDAPVAGSGQTFDWDQLDMTELAQPFFIAGGLNEDNVARAIQHFSPFAVDVSSGVETDGQKDHEKIRRFIERVKHGISGTK